MRNHFFLGELISKKFDETLFKSLKQVSVHVSSTRRTVASALSQLSGMMKSGSSTNVETPSSKNNWLPPNSLNKGDISYQTALPEGVNIFPLDIEGNDTNYMFWADDCKNIKKEFDETVSQKKKELEGKLDSTYQLYEKNGFKPEELFEDKKWSVHNVKLAQLIAIKSM